MMNRWIRGALLSASMTGALALVGGSVLAQETPTAQRATHGHRHRPGLLGEALKLDSLTPGQRTSIEDLKKERRAAAVPLRAADAQVLTLLATQVEQASIDHQALAASLNAESGAAEQEKDVEKSTLERLHALLTPAQRAELVERIAAEHARGHGDGGLASNGAAHHDAKRGGAGGMGAGKWAHSLGLTAEQRSQIAENLRGGLDKMSADNHKDGEARIGAEAAERGAKAAALQTFRADAFDASALVHAERRGKRAEHFAEAALPVLTPAQRAILAQSLRGQANHERG